MSHQFQAGFVATTGLRRQAGRRGRVGLPPGCITRSATSRRRSAPSASNASAKSSVAFTEASLAGTPRPHRKTRTGAGPTQARRPSHRIHADDNAEFARRRRVRIIPGSRRAQGRQRIRTRAALPPAPGRDRRAGTGKRSSPNEETGEYQGHRDAQNSGSHEPADTP